MKFLSILPDITKHVDFINTDKPDHATITEFGFNKVPYTILYYYENDKWNQIPLNPEILYSSLSSMVNNIVYHRTVKKVRKPFSTPIKQMNDNNLFKNMINQAETIVLAFLNASPGEENEKYFDTTIEKFEILSQKKNFKEWSYGWINSTCQVELTEKFKFLPDKGGVIVYQQWKEVYARFAFPYDDMFLYSFFEKIVENRFVSHSIDVKEMVLEENSCLQNSVVLKKEEEKHLKKLEEEIKKSKEFDDSMKTDL